MSENYAYAIMCMIYRVEQKWVCSYEYVKQLILIGLLIIVLFSIQTTVNLFAPPYTYIYIYYL